MRIPNTLKFLTLATIGLLLLPAFMPTSSTITIKPTMASYNPAPANNFHAPLSTMALVAVTGASPNIQNLAGSSSHSTDPSTLTSIQQNALRFINDSSYFPQSETTIAVDPANPDHILGGFNDAKYFLCPFLPADCAGSASVSLSGFTVSTDGGRSVAKSSDLPNPAGTPLINWGDPSVAASIDGNFFYASLAINHGSPIYGNGVMIAKSNSSLFSPNNSCATTISQPTENPCWKTFFVYGTPGFPSFRFEDKDRISVDRNPSSPYYGSVYVGWDDLSPFTGLSSSDLARCDGNLVSCTMLSGGSQPAVSGTDPFVAWTTPAVDKNGNVYVSWCNFGTYTTYGPVTCRIRSSTPGGTSFATTSNIISYMGTGTTLPTDTIVLGWATEQFRIAPGLISIATDLSPKSNNLYFTTQVCTSGHYYAFSSSIVPGLPPDNPGDCGQSAVIFSKSTDNGQTWSSPTTLSHPAVNDQPYVTVDTQTGTIYVVYYTTQYDPFNHRTDVVASTSNNLGKTFAQQRVTSVSDEPNADPNMYVYFSSFGGSFVVPEYGDYFEATAMGGRLWVLFTGNYAVEQGTFQTDPFLARL